ncbi:MAG: MarC family protein [Thermoanaerobaculia bacterium]
MPEVVLLSFVTLITMVNPLVVVPSFVALTDGSSMSTRARVALVGSIACALFLLMFLVAGNLVFKVFGITVPAFQIMGGTIFFANALRTLTHHDMPAAYTMGDNQPMADADVRKAEVDPASIAIVPLAIPMLAGPGAITSTMVLVNLYRGIEQKIAVAIGIIGVGLVTYIVLLAAVPLSRLIGERGRAVFTKVMALLLGAIGIQFIINGLKPVITEILRSAS